MPPEYSRTRVLGVLQIHTTDSAGLVLYEHRRLCLCMIDHLQVGQVYVQ
jgi:hypothetical protein